MEYFSMSDKILRSLESFINNDADLQDFTIVPTEDNTRNKSPVLYEEHHLGLESWCIKYVYQYICSELFKVRKCLSRKKVGHSKRDNLNYLLMGGLLINPDVTTFWNMRRELLEDDVLTYEEELKFSKLVLTRKNKSNEAFAYRRWLLKRILDKMSKNEMVPPIGLLENELSVCFVSSLGTMNNYHSWTHRIWCVKEFVSFFPDTVARELDFSEKWVVQHVSENTGYHYRQFLIDLFKTGQNNYYLNWLFDRVIKKLNIVSDSDPSELIVYLLGKPVKNTSLKDLSVHINYVVLLLYDLLILVKDINEVYMQHESLWLHRRFLIFNLLNISYEYLGENSCINKTIEFPDLGRGKNLFKINIENCSGNEEKKAKIFKSQPNSFESTNMKRIICDLEKKFLDKNLGGNEYQKKLATNYQKWLQYVVKLELY